MYLAPWQIFALGFVCGAVFAVIIAVIAIVRLVMNSGVRVEREEEHE